MQKIWCTLLALLAVSTIAVQAGNSFTLTNNTGLELKSIQFGPYDTTDQWGANALAAPLKDGDSISLTFTPHVVAEDWDIRAVNAEDEEIIFYLIPLATIKKVAITYEDYVPLSDFE